MVEAKEVQHGCMQVVRANLALDRISTQFVSGAIPNSAFHATARHPHRVALVVVTSTVTAVASVLRASSELATPEHQRVLELVAIIEVLQQRGDRAIDALAVLRQGRLQVSVLDPASTAHLNESHTGFRKPSSH